MPKANKGKRMLNMPEAAEYSAWAYRRGVEHGRREMRNEMLNAMEKLSAEAKREIERETNENSQNR